MSKNIVICFDGTNNQFGPENTNIVRLAQVLDRDPTKQHFYYDPGVGTLPEPGLWTRTGKRLSEIAGLAFGGGIFWKVSQAYQYLMDFWEPGDRVLIFGFSRGAYTARLLAAILHQMGLLPRGQYNLVPYIIRLFKSLPNANKPRSTEVHQHFRLCDEFRWSFGRLVPESKEDRRFHVHFLGLWDTVSSVGWAWNPPAYPFTARNPSVHVVRHAVSLDERRWFFRQNLISSASPDQDVIETWFPGVHSDVGGGYPEADGGLWRSPFNWIREEAQRSGLLVNENRLRAVLDRTPTSPSPCLDSQHESLKGVWWLAEFFPKLQFRVKLQRRIPAIGAGRHRVIPQGALIHRCALTRLHDKADYQPANLAKGFVDKVKTLPDVPEVLAYDG